MGITILIKIRTDQLNELEKEATEPPPDPNQTEPLSAHQQTGNLSTQTSNPTPTETTNHPHQKGTPECCHYFGYVSSGEKIPEECFTCSKLLKCLTSKDGVQKEETEGAET